MRGKRLKFLEDRIKVLENAIESHAKILARFQMMTEGDESVGGGFDFDEEKKS